MEPVHGMTVSHMGGTAADQPGVRREVCAITKTPGAAEIVFRSGTADRWKFFIAIQIHLNFAFTPPAFVVLLPGHITTGKGTAAADAVCDHKILPVFQRIGTAERCMEIGGIFRNFLLSQVDGIINMTGPVIAQIFQRHPGVFPERHLPVTVHGIFCIDANGKGLEFAVVSGGRTEKVAHGDLHAGQFFMIPIHPQDQHPEQTRRKCDPNVADHAGTIHIQNCRFFTGFQKDPRTDLAADADLSAGMRLLQIRNLSDGKHIILRRRTGSGVSHPAGTGFSEDIFAGNRNRFTGRGTGQIAKHVVEHHVSPV